MHQRLIGDLGGTHIRLALLSAQGEISAVQSTACADYPDFASAVSAYLQGQGSPAIHEAALAVATPIDGDRVALTNRDWSFSIDEETRRFGFSRMIVKNDFTALALSIPHLGEDDLSPIGGGQAVAGAAVAVIGPGTGLGVSGLVFEGDIPVAIAGEGGHVSLCAHDAREAAIVDYCRQKFGHVSAERLLSGMGLQNIYESLCAIDGVAYSARTPAEIGQAAQSGDDPYGVETVAIFSAMLGAVAGDLALTLGARGGVYIGGGIVPRLGPSFAAHRFRERFEDKGRFAAYLRAIPTFVLRAEHPTLLGLRHVF